MYKTVVEAECLVPAIFEMSGESIFLEVFPLARYIGAGSLYKTIKVFEQRALKLVKVLKNEILTSEEKETSIIHLLGELRQQWPEISDKTIDNTYVTLILAGVSTTTNTMYSLFNLILHHPKVYERLQKEVCDTLGHRRVTLADRTQLPYLMATIEETLRFTSILPLLVPHAAAVDTKLDGKPVPAGTPIFFNAWGLHHDPDIFPEPWVFKPPRFLNHAGSFLPVDHPTRRNVYAFGAGARVCIGEIVARTRLFLITATLLQRFSFTQGSVKAPYDPREYVCGNPLQCKPYTVVTSEPMSF